MFLALNEKDFEGIKEKGFFTADGCACGDFTYKLIDNVWLHVYRSCRKSSMTPNHKLWQLHEISFFDNIVYNYYNYNGEKCVDDIEEFGKPLEDYKLNNDEEQKIYEILKEKTRAHWRNEYRNEE